MATPDELFQAGRKKHQAGDLRGAQRAYRDLLAMQPGHAEGWNGLAMLELQENRPVEAEQAARQSIAADPKKAVYHHHLGVALRNQKKVEEALVAFQQAAELDPQLIEAKIKVGEMLERLQRGPEAVQIYREVVAQSPKHVPTWNSLGILLTSLGRYEEAVKSYQAAIKLDPQRAEPHNNLGNTYKVQRNLPAAIECYQKAIRLKPDYAKAHYNLGNVLQVQGKFHEAMASYQLAILYKGDYAEAHDDLANVLVQLGRNEEAMKCYMEALRHNPRYLNALHNLGTLFNTMHRPDEAQTCFERALAVNPKLPETHNNLGNVFKVRLELEKAMECYDRAIDLKPDYGKAHYNRANCLLEFGQFDEANTAYERAIECYPDYPEANFQHGILHLLRGDLLGGWPGYEWRWGMQNAQKGKRTFSQPTWTGEPLNGKTLLLYTEQGLGDTVQFIRYAEMCKARGARVVVEAQPRLVPLLKSCVGIDELIPRGTPLPEFDVQAALLSLPHIFQTTLETIPSKTPYLHADPELMARWREWLANIPGYKIGIVWQGSPTFLRDATRSIPLEHFDMLAELPDVTLITLQKGTGTEQIAELSGAFPIVQLPDDVDTAAGAYMDTAAIMQSLDLIVSSDTSGVHVAGALGIECWVALGYVPDWRWLLDRTDCPWYPSMRLFRQKVRDDWDGVFEEIAAEVEKRRA